MPVILCSTSVEIGGRTLNWPNCCRSLCTANDLAEKCCALTSPSLSHTSESGFNDHDGLRRPQPSRNAGSVQVLLEVPG
eukprot:1590711-Rhodomonas_salina.1